MLIDVDTCALPALAITEASSTGRIVMGFDGSPASHAALEWAAREKESRSKSAVRVVAGFTVPTEVDDYGAGAAQRARRRPPWTRHSGVSPVCVWRHREPTSIRSTHWSLRRSVKR